MLGGMIMLEFPNLEFIEEQFIQAIQHTIGHFKCPECEICVFTQLWGDTSLGFDGLGCQAITGAYTTVIYSEEYNIFGVFFGDKLAYIISNPNELFFDDMRDQNMKPWRLRGLYNKERNEEI